MLPKADGQTHPRHRSVRAAALLALGALAALGQAPVNLWWVTVLAFGAAIYLLPSATARAAFWGGWLLGVGYFAVSLRWIVSPFLVDVERDGWMAPFALVLMAGGIALFWGVASLLAHRYFRPFWLGLPVALTMAEAARSYVLTGFPWALVGHSLIDTPLSQLAAVGGPHLLTFLVLVVAAALAHPSILRTGGAAALAVAAWVLAAPPDAVVPGDAPVVRLIQPNAPQEEKWDPVMSRIFFERMLTFTGDEAVPDLVVWPESAIAMLLNYADDALLEISDVARGAPVILGVNREEGGLYYNSFVQLGRAGAVAAVYDKQHLVPFGEYIPGGNLLHQVGIQGFGSRYGGGFTEGRGGLRMTVPGIGVIRPLICYEGIFAEEIRGAIDRPRAMVLITNDAWFGKAAGPFQHLAQARLRSIEQGLPMVRVANTGVSAVIDAYGRVVDSIPLDTADYIDVPLPPARAATVYARIGDGPLIGLLIVGAIALWWRGRKNAVDPKHTAS